jgi:flagellar motor switch protein FliG
MPALLAPNAPGVQAADAPKLSRIQKLAALLVILGPDPASEVLKSFEPHEVEAICGEMAKLTMVSQQLRSEILREFSEVAVQAGSSVRGGVDVTRITLEKAIGLFKATEILSRVAPQRSSVPAVQEIIDMEPRQIYNLIRHEQPQTVALVLSYTGAEKAADVLSFFQTEQREQIVERIATLAPTPVEIVEKVIAVLVAKRGVSHTRALNQTGGVKVAADMLNEMDEEQGKIILASIDERNPELGQAIRQKMFTFEDLANLDPSMLQRVLREVDMRELALALKTASDKLRSMLLSCITKRAAEAVQEEMNFMGAVRLRDIESAQMRVLDAVRRLEAEGTVDLGEVRRGAHHAMA